MWLWSCASPGTPDGGPYDEEPPHVVGSSPVMGALGVKQKKVEIYFNEFIQLDNPNEKVVISPPQINQPEISTQGKRIKIQLLDTLKENTTYTVDFSDAIIDNNESNPMGNYTFVFSTGETIDTMEIAGYVLNAQNLEPVKGILVGLHGNLEDSAFVSLPLERVARTNGSGHFVIKGVRPGTYRAYALQEADGSFTFNQKSEMLAFLPDSFTTGSFIDVRPDTVWHDYARTRIDSIRAVHFSHFTPDDVVLLAFLEEGQERHLLKTTREVPEHFEVFFTAPDSVVPRIEGLNFDADGAFLVSRTKGNDTLQYWVRDTTLAYQDTLHMVYHYMGTDTTGVLREKADTLRLVPRITHEKQKKWHAEEVTKWQKAQDKLRKRGLPYETEFPATPLVVRFKSTGTLAPDENVGIEVPQPLALVDTSKIHLMLRKDSVYVPAYYELERSELSLLQYTLYAEWRPQQDYELVIDSAAFVGIYGQVSKAMKTRFNVPSLDRYSSLFLNLKGAGDSLAVVQLLNGDKPVSSVRSKKGRAEFYFVKPGNYYLRLFLDRNGNGEWDTGEYAAGRQAEETYYYPGKIELRAMWDVEQEWDIHAVPRYRQKPLEITKQKPDKGRTIKNRNAEREKNKR